jgi:hypothetical protein
VAAGILSIGRLATDYRPHHAGVNTQNTRAQTTLAVWRVLQQYYIFPFHFGNFKSISMIFWSTKVQTGRFSRYQPTNANRSPPHVFVPFDPS